MTSGEHEAKAAMGMKGLEALDKNEKMLVLSARLMNAARAFAESRGSADSWNQMETIMCAIQGVKSF